MDDVDLTPFRHGIATLTRKGGPVEGYVSTIVEPFWSPLSWPPFRRREAVWLLVTWLSGERNRIGEDYPPWTVVRELVAGRIELKPPTESAEMVFEARWLSGDAQQEAWTTYGIHHPPGHYMS